MLAEVDYFRAVPCLAADVWGVTCWCTFLLWCKALWCSRGWPTENPIQEQITVDLLFTHMGQLVAFPQSLTKPQGPAGHNFFVHSKCRVTWCISITTRPTDITDNQLAFRGFCQPDTSCFCVLIHIKIIYTLPTSRAIQSWWYCRPAVSKGKWGHFLQSLEAFTEMPGREREQPKVHMHWLVSEPCTKAISIGRVPGAGGITAPDGYDLIDICYLSSAN